MLRRTCLSVSRSQENLMCLSECGQGLQKYRASDESAGDVWALGEKPESDTRRRIRLLRDLP